MRTDIGTLLCIVTLSGCTFMKAQSPLELAVRIEPGMTKEQVQEIMGLPAKNEFTGNLEVWHYCRNGYNSDDFISIYFEQGKATKLQNYSITLAEKADKTGDCKNSTRPINAPRKNSSFWDSIL